MTAKEQLRERLSRNYHAGKITLAEYSHDLSAILESSELCAAEALRELELYEFALAAEAHATTEPMLDEGDTIRLHALGVSL